MLHTSNYVLRTAFSDFRLYTLRADLLINCYKSLYEAGHSYFDRVHSYSLISWLLQLAYISCQSVANALPNKRSL
jgi:hypothetical protein